MEGILLHDPLGLVAAAQLHPDLAVLLPEHDRRTQNSNRSDVGYLQKGSHSFAVGEKKSDR